MKSRMLNCYDYKKIEIPEEYRKWHIPDNEIAEELEALARDHSREYEPEDGAKKGDCVVCRCTDSPLESWLDREVLIYPEMGLPGAEEAEKQAVGVKKGDLIECTFINNKMSLAVESVVRREQKQVADAFMKGLKIDGVESVNDYYQWYRNEHNPDRRHKAAIRIVQLWMQTMADQSEFVIVEAEKKEWCQVWARLSYENLLEAGHDMRKRPDGSVVSKEEAIDQAAKEREPFFVAYLLFEYFSENAGYVITQEDYLTDITRLCKEQGRDPEVELTKTSIEFYKYSKYQEYAFTKVLCPIAEKYLED